MTIKLELWLCEYDRFNQVDSLYNNLINLLIHAHFDKLIKCDLKALFLSINCGYVLNDFLKCRLSYLPLRTLQAFNQFIIEYLNQITSLSNFRFIQFLSLLFILRPLWHPGHIFPHITLIPQHHPLSNLSSTVPNLLQLPFIFHYLLFQSLPLLFHCRHYLIFIPMIPNPRIIIV